MFINIIEKRNKKPSSQLSLQPPDPQQPPQDKVEPEQRRHSETQPHVRSRAEDEGCDVGIARPQGEPTHQAGVEEKAAEGRERSWLGTSGGFDFHLLNFVSSFERRYAAG